MRSGFADGMGWLFFIYVNLMVVCRCSEGLGVEILIISLFFITFSGIVVCGERFLNFHSFVTAFLNPVTAFPSSLATFSGSAATFLDRNRLVMTFFLLVGDFSRIVVDVTGSGPAFLVGGDFFRV